MNLDHVCMSTIEWGYLWQGPQEVMAFMSAQGGNVLYVENTGIRRPHLRDAGRVIVRLGSWTRHPRGHLAPIGTGVTVLSPLAVPLPWSALARAVNRGLVVDRIRDHAVRLGMEWPVVWTFLPNLLSLDVLRAFRARRAMAVYYCMQDFQQVTDNVVAMRQAEDDILGEVDLVITGARGIHRRFEGRHPDVILAPVTVADTFFSPPRPEPHDLRGMRRPRVGYVGGIHRYVDMDLIAAAARECPDVEFVFIGPLHDPDRPLPTTPNVHHLGRRSHSELPAYIDAFDACMVPYRRLPFTETVWPTKLHEYLARGRPVVSTSLPEVAMLEYPGSVVRMADDPAAFAAAIRDAISDKDPDGERLRRATAATQSSAVVLGAVRSTIQGSIERRGLR